jgi:hypothetical protein
MLSRATFLGTLGALSAGIILTIAGLLTGQGVLSLAGLAALAAAGIGRSWLRHRGELEPAERALNAIDEQALPLDETRGRQLLALLQEWEALEQKRGSAAFDPWALQALRNDIRQVVESDPALAQLFRELQKAA